MFKDVLKVCKISIFTIFLLKLKLKIFFCQISIFLISREIEVEDFFWQILICPIFLVKLNLKISLANLNLLIFLLKLNFTFFFWQTSIFLFFS